ncbi:energy-coupling factor transporter transmembrane component T family protein [Furfurilactobacillus siliginis]|uniref:ABC transporter permease n=1 Tax=Furfurilactobacillus siliginis TaxID=348151 RepID=A0A0R2L514_9LACO|nr:energy-coupling factor transporter transmembrane component T [Furfurilactobacillus siliginis]KRN96448.1 thiamin ABC transporter permease [Furfurilactobacillus siliginis]GEK28920.1 ABC transporter permease [Furfurilactobacillus siliginis]
MNPTLLLLLTLLVGLEISFTSVIWANVVIIAIAIVVMLRYRVHWLTFVRLLLIPLIPAVGIWFSIRYFSTAHSVHFAWVMSTRIYAYAFLGGLFNAATTTNATLASLEQNGHIPTTFVYGMLGAFNFVPKIHSEVAIIRASARMRGVNLHFWSPQLLFKAIVAALNWSENLAEAMTSHGFTENAQRTHLKVLRISIRDYVVAGITLVVLQFILFSHLP